MSKFIQRDRNFAFTLAEMMVVMLILTIVLAAFAPLMTKRKNVDLSSSPWRYTDNNNGDIYYGLGGSQTAMIGQNIKDANDPSSRLLIKTESDGQAYITLKDYEQGVLGGLYWQAADSRGGTLRLGGPYDAVPTEGENTAMGQSALKSLTSGSINTAMGSSALSSNTTGISNTAFGVKALSANISGNSNTAVGTFALQNNSGSIPKATFNTAVGASSMSANTSGYNNTAIGGHSLVENLTGYGNTAVGYSACKYVTGANKTCIGANSGPASTAASASDNSNVVYIGTANSVVYIPGTLVVGKNAILNNDVANSYTAIQSRGRNYDGRPYKIHSQYNGGGENYYSLYFNRSGGDIADPADSFDNLLPVSTDSINPYSDKRLKNIKGENKSGLEQIRELKIFDYTFKADKDKIPQVGVIAQDLQKVFPDAVTEAEDGYLKIRLHDMFYASINSIKQLDTIVQGILNELKVHLEKITNLANRIKVLEDENKLLKKQLNDLNKRLEKLENDD